MDISQIQAHYSELKAAFLEKRERLGALRRETDQLREKLLHCAYVLKFAGEPCDIDELDGIAPMKRGSTNSTVLAFLESHSSETFTSASLYEAMAAQGSTTKPWNINVSLHKLWATGRITRLPEKRGGYYVYSARQE